MNDWRIKWNEADHPRDESGRFNGSGGGQGASNRAQIPDGDEDGDEIRKLAREAGYGGEDLEDAMQAIWDHSPTDGVGELIERVADDAEIRKPWDKPKRRKEEPMNDWRIKWNEADHPRDENGQFSGGGGGGGSGGDVFADSAEFAEEVDDMIARDDLGAMRSRLQFLGFAERGGGTPKNREQARRLREAIGSRLGKPPPVPKKSAAPGAYALYK